MIKANIQRTSKQTDNRLVILNPTRLARMKRRSPGSEKGIVGPEYSSKQSTHLHMKVK